MKLFARIFPLGALLLASVQAFAVGTPHTVTVGGNGNIMSPAQLTITAGDTVTFHNAGNFHNVVEDHNAFRCAKGCDDQTGGNGSPSGDLWTATRQFDTPGVIHYHCEVHGLMMSGTITVQPAETSFAIGPGISGSWYNDQQSGHGFEVQILPTTPPQMLVFWFVFAPQGGQAWIVAQGTIEGDHAVLTAAQGLGSGGRFPPNFDAANVHATPWGTMTFTFTDCTHGRVDYDSTVPGYGSGSLTITPLSHPAGTTCP